MSSQRDGQSTAQMGFEFGGVASRGLPFPPHDLDVPPLFVPALNVPPRHAPLPTSAQLDVPPLGVPNVPPLHVPALGASGSLGGVNLPYAPPFTFLSSFAMDVLTLSGSIHLSPTVRVGPQGLMGTRATLGTPSFEEESLQLKDLDPVGELGHGCSGRVRLVRHLAGSGKLYALKEISVSFDRRELQEHANEIQISTCIESEHVVKCHKAFYREGRLSLILEHMDGGTLADLLAKAGRISEVFLADIARQALRGFADLHQHRPSIIHRDIKPSNLLFNRAGQLKISDFGVSRILDNSSDIVATPSGTYAYMSPERLAGEVYTTNSDIWAFGLCLLECAIGRHPYQPETDLKPLDYFSLLEAISQRPPPEASPQEFSKEFCDFIRRCLQARPEKRWGAVQLLQHPFCQKYEHTLLKDLLSALT